MCSTVYSSRRSPATSVQPRTVEGVGASAAVKNRKQVNKAVTQHNHHYATGATDRPRLTVWWVWMRSSAAGTGTNENAKMTMTEDPEHYPPISSRGTRTPHVWMGPYQHVCKREKLHKSNLSSQIWHWTRIFKIISHFYRLWCRFFVRFHWRNLF